MHRRRFLKQSMALATIAAFPALAGVEANDLRAVIIGHTGHGDYGHELDAALTGVPGVQVVAVADPDSAGRARAAQRTGARRQYADYREMLRAERPQLVVVAPRWSEEHRNMALAAIDAGAHVLMEKPITVTLAEADELLTAARKANRKIAVAHQMRLAPAILHLKHRIDQGLLGELLQVDAYGKQDARAGGEDMLVLGVHLFDLMRLFAGDARWCTARIQQNGHDITKADAHSVKEGIGPVAGDNVFAQFGFDHGVNATFTSRAGRQQVDHWGIRLTGSKGSARIAADIWPTVYVMDAGQWEEKGRTDVGRRLADDPMLRASPADRAVSAANRRVADDWLAAIRKNEEPTCSGDNAAKALEMVMATYHAALAGTRMALPLKARSHPLIG